MKDFQSLLGCSTNGARVDPLPPLQGPREKAPQQNTPNELIWLKCERFGCEGEMLVGLTDYLRSIATGTLVHCESCKHLPADVDALFQVEL